MKTLLQRAEAVLASTKDWFNGKEPELHRKNAEVVRDLAAKVEALEQRVLLLEDSEAGRGA